MASELMAVTDQARAVARELMRSWGRKPQIVRHWDEAERNYVDVATLHDSPVEGITAVGTVGFSDHDLGMGPVRVELLGAFPTSFEESANVAATCVFNAIKDKHPVRPNAVHQRVMELYLPSSPLPHVLFVDPFLWPEGPKTLHLGDISVAWLMMMPISESEMRLAASNGAAVLTDLFEKNEIDIFDLARSPVI